MKARIWSGTEVDHMAAMEVVQMLADATERHRARMETDPEYRAEYERHLIERMAEDIAGPDWPDGWMEKPLIVEKSPSKLDWMREQHKRFPGKRK